MQNSKTNPLYITRFIAAYMVLIYHYIPGFFRTEFFSIAKFDEPVNYFFFISGFVMVVSSKRCIDMDLHQVKIDKKDFWMRRFARIYPLYFIALLLFVVFNYTVLEIDPSIPKRFLPELLGIQRWIYKGSINFPDWTVSCEFFFYLVFPFALPWIFKTSLKKTTIVLSTLFLFNLIANYFFSRYISNLETAHNIKGIHYFVMQSLYNHPIFKLTIFLGGCLCGRCYLEYSGKKDFSEYSGYIVLLCLILIVLGYMLFPAKNPLLFSGILCLVYFPFVFFICNLKEGLLNILSFKLFIFFGEISYGMYILQAPVEHYFQTYLTNNKIENGYQFFSYTIVLIVLSSLFFIFFETPVKKWIIHSFHKKSASGEINKNIVLSSNH